MVLPVGEVTLRAGRAPAFHVLRSMSEPPKGLGGVVIPLTDNPVRRRSDDRFGFLPYVRALHTAVAAADPLPLTVGVFGSWGTGKSSFLGLWRDLFAEEGTRTIWFNPWKYDRKVEVWAALLHTVLAEMEQEERLRDRVGRLARAATWLSVRAGLGHAATLATGGLVTGGDVDGLLDTLSTTDAQEYRQINAFESGFAEAVADFVGPDGRLVVFVDDLDRCTPDAAVTVLESLKLFLGESRCVFVLALDVDVLSAVATNKFGRALAGAPAEAVSGSAYLEKIVQLPFFLPDVDFVTLQAAFRPSVPSLGDNQAFWDLVRIGLGVNPRRIKRFLNVLNLSLATSEALTGRSPSATEQLQLAELLIIQSRFRAFYHLLAREPDAWSTLEQYVQNLRRRPQANREAALAMLPVSLAGFAADGPLLALLDTSPGSYHDHPPAPAGNDVLRMISTLRSAAGPDPALPA